MSSAASSSERGPLEQAALDLCARLGVRPGRARPIEAWARLHALPAWLDRARSACARDPSIGKACEWLLDNDYLIQRAIHQIREDLPPGFHARLPACAGLLEDGLPRVFALAQGFARASHLQVSLDAAVRFVNAYQEEDALTIAELWAFPTMLRILCLELVVAGMARLVPPLGTPFDPSPGTDTESVDETELVARGIGNLAVISSIPWKEFFTATSRVEAVLCEDPAGVYAHMDFETRDAYRNEVEELATRSPLTEVEVAARVVEHARAAAAGAPAAHVGFWLLGDARPRLEASVAYRPGWRTRWRRRARRAAGPLYASALAGATGLALALPLAYLAALGAGPGALLLAAALALIPASALGFTLVHWALTLLVAPRVLPKLDFRDGIPPEHATLVAVPVLVASVAEAHSVLEQLERHCLANPDPSLRFALLSDLPDAPSEHMPGDEAIVEALRAGVRQLNERCAARECRRPFHLLHRERRFNPREGCWMGWERKRGKLEELDRLLLGGPPGAFPVREGDTEALRGIRFVVTADADTILPADSVARLAGALAHPLNRAVFDEAGERVVAGYTVLQPRIEIAPAAGQRTAFARLYSGDTAIDIYTRAVSDVYQDLFGTGIFVGKGIYDVAAFRRSLAGKVPEDALASHDLFEGIHGRVALASDVVFYEEFPAGYLGWARRWHRWVRGDWQLTPWLGRRVPGPGGARLPNRLGALDRWKIADNLRRSLVPPALVALLVAGWLVLPGAPLLWTALAVLAPAASLFTELVTGLGRGRRRGAVSGTLRALRDHAGRWLLAIVFVVQDALVALDAIVRTLWRVFVSRRHLLEWTPAAHDARWDRRPERARTWRALWPGPALAAALVPALWAVRPGALLAAGPVLLLWLASPEIALWTGRPRRRAAPALGASDRAFLRRMARRTWLFFETFVGPDDHWLPPDNHQEDPLGEVAHRTSPTNIGMMLVASLGACDLGFHGVAALAARLRHTFDTLERMQRYRGHLLNWYDTRTLEPLQPRYVSTVDSGNLAASLVALRGGCEELAGAAVVHHARWDGLADTIDLLLEATEALRGGGSPALQARFERIRAAVRNARDEPAAWTSAIATLCEQECPALEKLLVEAVERGEASPEALRELRIWLERAHHHLRAMQRDLDTFLPWLACLRAAPAALASLAGEMATWLPPDLPLDRDEPAFARARARIAEARTAALEPDGAAWLTALGRALEAGASARRGLRESLLALAARAEALALEMDFGLLFDPESRLFHIGYDVGTGRVDPHHYDLLASEARTASLVAIAKGDVPVEHWFHLGRPITRTPGGLALVSWGGSAFEYLMPPLLVRSGPGTLLAQSERAAVEAQRRYGASLGVPWGISESGFASLDPEQRYRYRAFGTPGLGLRRGLSRDLVVAPYASALALPLRPEAVVANLRALARLGAVGRYGFFEAVDFTPARVPEGRRCWVVRSYMAHHQGMILAAIVNTLADAPLVRRFHADQRIRAIAVLLDERIPRELPAPIVRAEEHAGPEPRRRAGPAPAPWTPAPAPFPQYHLLGNGRLATWISEAGGGGLRWREHALTRWLPDPTCDDHGLWIYVQDEASGAVWSATRQPTGVRDDEPHVVFHAHLAQFHRRDHGIALGLEVGVAAADDLEIRRLTLVNESDEPRTLRITSYGEVVLARPLDDERHPAFSKLFVESEWLPDLHALQFTRRPRQPSERPPALLHRVVSDEPDLQPIAFESDRRAFLGRNGSARQPRGLHEGLAGATGFTLDAVMALQVRVRLAPRQRRQLAFVTLVAPSRDSLRELAERYATLASLDWALRDAATEAVHELERLQLDPGRLPALQTLAALLVSPHAALRAPASVLETNRLGQPRLWGLGLSGDAPILLLRANDPGSDLLRLLVQAWRLWSRRGLLADLVLLRTDGSSYEEPLRERVFELLHALGAHELLGRKGGVHLLFADQMRAEESLLLEAMARAVLDDADGSLEHQLEVIPPPPSPLPPFEPRGRGAPEEPTPALARPEGLRFDNGFGGFADDGRTYVIHLAPGERTPAPWCNVLANDDFGSVVSEAGLGFTWAVNSGENRITGWTGDPVADRASEALYLRDEETAAIWTVTPEPAGDGTPCQVRHGAGYSEWCRWSQGLAQELRVFVPPDDPVKLVRLHLRNLGPRPRLLTATYYAHWLLGALGSVARPHVVCAYDPALRALLARNPWDPLFAERVAFLAASQPPIGITGDRREFLGPEGDGRRPAGLVSWTLSDRVPAAADPCAAYQVALAIAPGGEAVVTFALGQGRDRAHADALVRRWRDPEPVERGWQTLHDVWEERLGAVQVRTPDPGFDLMVNRWLPYQAFASRVLARAGFYQASGAFGFRDQLQDLLALLLADPARARAHLLACAAHQFEEGDVLHWWHPPSGRGVRTRCSDDLLWLPYGVAHYVEVTGDAAILDEEVPFLHAPPLRPDEDDRYAAFETAPEPRSLFEHCERALERGVTRGAHGLPLIGSGDWNDGMDRVGRRGVGESVWLGWFAIAAMQRFAGLCRLRGRDELAASWTRRAEELGEALERSAWDGGWYVRAFDDDGRPWGSATCDECRIDSIAQSWAVLSGAGAPDRARLALDAAERELVRDGVARLLWPPFDRTPREPGYIKAYPPGVRENGGQYSHAAAWLGWAFAARGEREKAARVLDLLLPVRRSASREDAEHYRAEPYVMAADVAAVAPHTGRGGWTWYTGSAAWTWRLAVEALLGLRVRGGELIVDPCLPPGWDGFEARVRGPAGTLELRVEDPDRVGRGRLEAEDGSPARVLAFPGAGARRAVRLRIAPADRPAP